MNLVCRKQCKVTWIYVYFNHKSFVVSLSKVEEKTNNENCKIVITKNKSDNADKRKIILMLE